ncbi:MAG: GGDEF domain-containing protein [Actinomycetota bacterium]|nr:GGDEF domain-containing protein [Actinomycetota bacterium]
MGWQWAAGLNVVIALCYVAIAGLISVGLIRTKQVRTNPLALATAAIFLSCAAHHGHHGLHLLLAFGGHESPQDLAALRTVFGETHTVAIDAVGAAVAIIYLGLRRNYKALLNTPQMFDDRVRLAAEEALRDLAFTDILTGIPNRAAYQALADGWTYDNQPAVVLFLDLDGFKAVNDRFGHDVGDRVLRDVAHAVAGVLREDEYVFRLGGDEMIVVGIAHDGTGVLDLKGRVEAAVVRPVSTRDGTITIAASCGVAEGAASSIGSLLRAADQDMYRIKADRWARGLPGPRSANISFLDRAR